MHKQLHYAVKDHDIWHLTKTHNGQQVKTFPPLKATDGTLVDNPTLKANIFKARFFPTTPLLVATIQDTDPLPRNTHTWMPITAAVTSRLGPCSLTRHPHGHLQCLTRQWGPPVAQGHHSGAK